MSISTTKPIASVTYNGTEIALKTVEKEVWVLNSTVVFPASVAATAESVTYPISFSREYRKANGERAIVPYTSITFKIDTEGTETSPKQMLYGSESTSGASQNSDVLNMNAFYRKLIFDTPPSGDLLTWLEANGVKQTANLAMQPSQSVSITSNGTTTVVPDAPFDGVASVAVTTNVPGVQWYSPVS
nr:MAG TPA: hypothetical protein [Caudoviricetes sp.]